MININDSINIMQHMILDWNKYNLGNAELNALNSAINALKFERAIRIAYEEGDTPK